jgi:hypothetical protein
METLNDEKKLDKGGTISSVSMFALRHTLLLVAMPIFSRGRLGIT